MSDIINIIVRIMPSGDELDVELPRYSTGKEIIEELLSASVAPRIDPNGNPYAYDLVSKASNVRIEDSKTLDDLRIKEGDTILFIPHLVAG